MTTTPPAKGRALPAGRLSRLLQMGGLAAGLAGGALAQGARGLARGERPGLEDLLLTPANAVRLTDRLATMRGAAMKVGQLLSMDAGEVLPPELSAVLARLRSAAEPMPPRQLGLALDAEWGRGWQARFAAFDVRPVAAASIGQVHRARTRDGRDVAVKVQYPGVARSIDSDVDNVAALLRLSGLVPASLDTGPLLAEAKRALRDEADYDREGACLQRFAGLLAGDEGFRVPVLHADLSTPRVLVMSWEAGEPLEALADGPQEVRDDVAARLIDLGLRELFAWGWMQTDPNLANYLWNGSQVVLLDFGASQAVAPEAQALYRGALRAALDGQGAEAALEAFAVIDARTPQALRREALAVFERAADALLDHGPYDFGDGALVAEMRERGTALVSDREAWRLPPAATMFVQRKLGGLYLMAARLGARVDLRAVLARHA